MKKPKLEDFGIIKENNTTRNNEPLFLYLKAMEDWYGLQEMNKVADCIPYQSCPLCSGSGQILADGFTSGMYQTCTACNGDRIIPMHRQLDLGSVEHNDSSRKTPINEWEHINKCSVRLRHILYFKPIYLGYKDGVIDGWGYIENISRSVFLMQRNAGIKSWDEFVLLRGY